MIYQCSETLKYARAPFLNSALFIVSGARHFLSHGGQRECLVHDFRCELSFISKKISILFSSLKLFFEYFAEEMQKQGALGAHYEENITPEERIRCWRSLYLVQNIDTEEIASPSRLC